VEEVFGGIRRGGQGFRRAVGKVEGADGGRLTGSDDGGGQPGGADGGRAWVWEEAARGRGHVMPVDALAMLLWCSRYIYIYIYIYCWGLVLKC
jgi:hypothetical protein